MGNSVMESGRAGSSFTPRSLNMSTYAKFLGNDTDRVFTFTFPYLDRSHVSVRVNSVFMLSPGDYEWIGVNSVQLRVPPKQDDLVEIRRLTPPSTRLVNFQNGAVLTADDLNVATLQNFYRTEELQDQIDGYIGSGIVRFASNNSASSMTADEMIAAVSQEILSSELMAELQSRITDIDFNAETILAQTQRVDVIQGALDALSDPDGGSGIVTLIENEANARIDGDTAIVDTLALIGARSSDNLAFILDTGTVKVSPTESLATRFSALQAQDASNLAAIQAEQTARTAADTAETTARTTLAARVTTAEGNITSNAAAITSESSARASGDSANASSITTLQTRMTTAEGNISTAAVQISANVSSIAAHGTTLGSLTAQYVVKTDVNGRVAGFGLYNTGATSDFIVLANRFAVVDPADNANVKAPFIVAGGVVYMQNVVIGNAVIGDGAINARTVAANSITANKLSVSSLDAITATIGLLRTATSGQRVEIESNQIRVYDSAGTLRVRMGVW
jgi:Phage T7 tail fibre protein/Domain of unknown function (DUF1983)